jgi:hypothetical protein
VGQGSAVAVRAQTLPNPKAHAWIYTHHIDWDDKIV